MGGFAATLAIGLFSFTIPLSSLDEKVTGAWLGSAFAGFYLAKLLTAPVAGLFSDKVGPRPLLIGAAAFGSVVPLIYFVDQSLPVLYTIQFCLGLVSGLMKPLGQAVLGASMPRETLARCFAFHTLAFNVALVAGPLLGGLLYFNGSMMPVIAGLCVFMILSMLATAFLLPFGLHTKTTQATPARQESAERRYAPHLFLALTGRTLGIGLAAAFYPIMLAQSLANQGFMLGLLFALPSFVTCLALPIIGPRLRRGNGPFTVAAGMIVSGCGLLGIGAATTHWDFAAYGSIMGLGAALSAPTAMALASDFSRRQGAVFGMAHAAAGTGFLIGPIIGGLLIQNNYAVGTALQFGGIVGVSAAIPLLLNGPIERLGLTRSWTVATAMSCAVLATAFGMAFLPAEPTLSPPSRDEHVYRYKDVAMGTVVRLTLETADKNTADEAARKALAAMRESQNDYDFRQIRSSIARINRSAGEYWVKPTAEAYDLIERALLYSEVSDGAFDPTIGALTTSPLYYAMSDALADSKRHLVDYRLVELDTADRRVRLKKKGMALDLGGIAKGAIIDEAVELLRSQGIRAGIVEAGGDFRCFGDRSWKVGIRHPRQRGTYATLSIREQAVCGSGDYQQYVDMNDESGTQRRHHIMNPFSMRSANRSIGVTVIADSAEKADALATMLFILGPEEGRPLMRKFFPRSAAMWFGRDRTVTATTNFPLPDAPAGRR
ncbi:MFS transporter [Salidesulfovibrio brasiliensis]|uniref:MFS transporter n=1 Tax=Salidesulfovibrio brasiliensis TaxID=221711 RepID=UPI001FE1AA12|nr:MFS transporter [Salidesulfovibrio brasiliensis]